MPNILPIHLLMVVVPTVVEHPNDLSYGKQNFSLHCYFFLGKVFVLKNIYLKKMNQNKKYKINIIILCTNVPKVIISQIRTAKDQTSLWIENLCSIRDSGDIHLTGR